MSAFRTVCLPPLENDACSTYAADECIRLRDVFDKTVMRPFAKLLWSLVQPKNCRSYLFMTISL